MPTLIDGSFLFVFAARKIFTQASPLVLCLGGLLFATHPIHTDAISSVVGRAEALSGLFILLSFLAYTSAFDNHDRTKASYLLIVLSIALSAVALLCKEQGITVLAVNAAYDFSVVCELDVPTFFSLLFGRQRKAKSDDDAPASSAAGTDGPVARWPAHFTAFLRRMMVLCGGLVLIAFVRYRIGPGDVLSEEQTNRACYPHAHHTHMLQRRIT